MEQNFSAIDEMMGFDPSNLEVFQEKTSKYTNPNIYKTNPINTKSADGHYHSTVRLLYNPFDLKRSIVHQATYWLEDENGGFLVKSKLGDGDRSCEIFKAWKKLHFSKDEELKKFADGLCDKNESDWVLVQILEDDNQPELVGQIKVMKLPQAVYDKLKAKLNPSPESKKSPVKVMDYLVGLPLLMDVTPGPDDPANPTRKQREISYNLCDFDGATAPIISVDGTPLFSDEELDIISDYSDAIDEYNKAKTDVKRDAAKAKAAQLAPQLKPLYTKAYEYLKENCKINLVEECGFTEWDAQTTERVKGWCDIFLTGRDPRLGAATATPTATPAPAPVMSQEARDGGIEIGVERPDDLPF